MYEVGTRVFDLGLSIPVALLLSALMLAIAIKLDSRGSVIYFGRRIGQHGRPFHIYKFRTMAPDAEQQGTTTAKNDPRVTRVGRMLRRYKLDELPQLFNVIRGEMSFVG